MTQSQNSLNQKPAKIPTKYTTLIPRIFILLFLVLLASWMGHLGWHTIQLFRLASQASTIVQTGVETLTPEEAANLVQDASSHLTAVEADMHIVYPVLKAGTIIPGIGAYVGQVQPLLTFATSLAQAGNYSTQALSPLWQDINNGNAEAQSTQRIFQVLVDGKPNFELAAQSIDRADQERQQINADLLPDRIQTYFLKLNQNFPLIKQGIAFLPLLPNLMGAEQPVTFLVLAQNRDEIRATGGFITGIGTIQLDKGQMVEFDMGDSYRIDDFSKPYPPPPEPLQRLMLAGIWVARDANWSPDFPTAAQQAQSLYTLSTGRQINGVVAFDQSAIVSILKALGPVSLSNAPELITAENVETYMQQSWAPEPTQGINMEWWEHRKDFMGSLGKALLEKIFQVRDPQTLIKIAGQMLQSMQEGHLLVYFDDSQAQTLLAQIGLDHSIQPGEGDFLMVVDSNIGFNKVDPVVHRTIDYEVDLTDPTQPNALVTLYYQHTIQAQVPCQHVASYGQGTYEDMRTRCYWDYWRVYSPSGSKLTGAEVKSVPGEQLLNGEAWSGEVENYPGEAGTQVFAGVLVLPPGQSETIRLQLVLPGQVVAMDESGALHYNLRLQRQPGFTSLSLQLLVNVPNGYTFERATHSGQLVSPSQWMWSNEVNTDQNIELVFIPK